MGAARRPRRGVRGARRRGRHRRALTGTVGRPGGRRRPLLRVCRRLAPRPRRWRRRRRGAHRAGRPSARQRRRDAGAGDPEGAAGDRRGGGVPPGPFAVPDGATIAELERSDVGELSSPACGEAGDRPRCRGADDRADRARLRSTADIEMAAIRAAATPPASCWPSWNGWAGRAPGRPAGHVGAMAPPSLRSTSPCCAIGAVPPPVRARRSPDRRGDGISTATAATVSAGTDGAACHRGRRTGGVDEASAARCVPPGRCPGRPAVARFANGSPASPRRSPAAGQACRRACWRRTWRICCALRRSCAEHLPGLPADHALAPRWQELDRPDDLDAACRWLCTRPPSDGELAWVAAVARAVFAARDVPSSPIHGLREEAAAIASLDHDEVAAEYLAAAVASTRAPSEVEG